MRRTGTLIAVLALLSALLPLAACGSDEPVAVSREALGTVVSVTAYGEDEVAVRAAIDDAFATMAEVESDLDAYDPESAVSDFNAAPFEWHELPTSALEVLDAVDTLDAADEFSVGLFGVSQLYDFEGEGHVPTDGELSAALQTASMPEREGHRLRFLGIASTTAKPGLDFGGAAKGLALDRARESLRASGVVTAALISSGSSTVTLGTKPDGSVWRIGIEDPRDPETIVATFAFESDGALSTSGDYQRYFEHDGVRYHHILDPATGLPARGIRSLTIAAPSLSGLDTDILSTALFVRGAAGAVEYAEAAGAALYVVDDEGRAQLVPAPADSGLTVAEEATPKR
ncbi:MAG: FAD:protein FMN transferase [Actinobacteria bacterium]|nr:FAD:protein FMN transferase [Actinomycetota bacterium]